MREAKDKTRRVQTLVTRSPEDGIGDVGENQREKRGLLDKTPNKRATLCFCLAFFSFFVANGSFFLTQLVFCMVFSCSKNKKISISKISGAIFQKRKSITN